jgi:hypothetical protein
MTQASRERNTKREIIDARYIHSVCAPRLSQNSASHHQKKFSQLPLPAFILMWKILSGHPLTNAVEYGLVCPA